MASGHFAPWIDRSNRVHSSTHTDYLSFFHLLPSQTQLAEVVSVAVSNNLTFSRSKLTRRDLSMEQNDHNSSKQIMILGVKSMRGLNYSLQRVLLNFSIMGEQGMAQWREGSPPTNVSRVRFSHPASYVGWVSCWFSTLLREVYFPGTSVFHSPQKWTSSNSNWILECTGISEQVRWTPWCSLGKLH